MYSSQLNEIIRSYIRTHGATPHVIESLDDFYSKGLNLVLSQFFKVEQSLSYKRTEQVNGKNVDTLQLLVSFDNIEISRPINDQIPMMPSDARLNFKTYSGRLTCDVFITLKIFFENGEFIERKDELIKHYMADIPIATGSILCNTRGMTNEAKMLVKEDPIDPQGYFIVNGTEWFINNTFSRKYNIYHVFHNEFEHKVENARAEMISKPGDSFENSSEIIIKLLKTGEITVTLSSDRYFKLAGIPFFVFMRLLGLQTEKSMVENIAPQSGNAEVDKKIRNVIKAAIEAKYKLFPDARAKEDNISLKKYCISILAVQYVNGQGIIDLKQKKMNIEKEIKILDEKFMPNIDTNLFPHQGILPENRFMKALYLSIGINLLIKCYLDIYPSTSRDSYEIKRFHTAGDSFSHSIKKAFNKNIIYPIKENFRNFSDNNAPDKIDLKNMVSNAIGVKKTEAAIIKDLNSGNSDEKDETGKPKKNKMPSESFKKKSLANIMNCYSVTRSPNSAGSYQNERAYEMRMPRGIGVNCMIQSVEGKNTGMITNTTLGMKISKSTATEVMRNFILDSGLILPWNSSSISNKTKITINGQWIGYTEKKKELMNYARETRRGWDYFKKEKIKVCIVDRNHSFTENYTLDFRTDRGRGLCPMLVVRNNTDEDPIGQLILGSKAGKNMKDFEQRILFTPKHYEKLLKREITFDDLFDEGFIDYIAPEELIFCKVADNLEDFLKNKNNPLERYTNVFIPITLLSCITALSPWIHHASPIRLSLATNYIRQTCSVFSLVPNSRFDKQGYICLHNEYPMVATISNDLIPVNGLNCSVLVASYGGGNMEDGLIINRSACDSGLFFTTKYTFVKSVLEKHESFCKPEESSVDLMNRNANYEKLNAEGFAPVGTIINKGDVIIGKKIQNHKSKSGKNFKDRSEIYYGETARICGFSKGIDSNYKSFIAVRIEIARPVNSGHKFASRMGQKGMAVEPFRQSDMPFNKRGEIPDLILSPFALPTRMTVNQLIESLYSKMGVLYGETYDGTFMVATNLDEVQEKLEAKGFDRFGEEVYYSGFYGRAFRTTLFEGWCYYHRLQKFVEENAYAVSNGMRSADRQPVAGISNNGGLRLGEMELWCFYAHGIVRTMLKKFTYDGDGTKLYICRACGIPAIVNLKKKFKNCGKCGLNSEIVSVPSRFSPYMLLELFQTIGVKINYVMEPRIFL